MSCFHGSLFQISRSEPVFAHVHILHAIFASFLFLYPWLFIASIVLIMGQAVLPKTMEEFALSSNKGSGNAKCEKFHLLDLFYRNVYTSVSAPNLT